MQGVELTPLFRYERAREHSYSDAGLCIRCSIFHGGDSTLRIREAEILVRAHLGGIEPHRSQALSVLSGSQMHLVGESLATAGMQISIKSSIA